MELINFENLPSTNTPINAQNLNQMQKNIEEAIDENIPKILWNNPNGTNAFGGQVITTIQDYNMYSIVFAVKIDGYYYYKSTGILPYNLRASLQSVGEGTIRRRNIENISKGSFEFNVCKDLETGSEDNADCIPIQIIGYSTEL